MLGEKDCTVSNNKIFFSQNFYHASVKYYTEQDMAVWGMGQKII